MLLVNAIFDGLNLVAKEAPLVNARNGVLVLSENTGAHEELGEWAMTVNPFDVAGQAEAIHEALELPEDERARRLDGDPRPRARARPRRLDRGPARRPRAGGVRRAAQELRSSAMDATLVGGELRSVNPATLEVVGAVAVTPLEAVSEAVAEARLAQQQWARTSFAERRAPARGGRARSCSSGWTRSPRRSPPRPRSRSSRPSSRT